MEVKAGWRSSEFWLHLVAQVLPGLVASIVATVAPQNAAAAAAVSVVSAVAGNYAATQYSDARTALKQAAGDMAAKIASAVAASAEHK